MRSLTDLIAPTSRLLIVHSPRPIDEARAIVEDLVAGRSRPMHPRGSSGVFLVDGAVDGLRVSFRVVPKSSTPLPGAPAEARPLEFTGTIDESMDGSVLTGSISAPTALGLPAMALTVLVALFLAWNGIPLALVAIGVAAWIFLTVIVVGSLQEQRLGEADAIQRFLEDALA